MSRLPAFLLVILCLVHADRALGAAADEKADEADARMIARLIEQLGSSVFREREQASSELAGLGEDAVAALREALDSQKDPEILYRVRRLLAAHDACIRESAVFAKELLEVIAEMDDSCLWKPNKETCVREVVRTLFGDGKRKAPPNLERRLKKAGTMTRAQLVALLRDLYARGAVGSKRPLKQLSRETIQRAMTKVDPYARLIPEEELVPWNTEAVSPIVSVGLRLAADPASGFLRVITPERGSPADRGGIRAGDVLTHITLITDREGHPLDPAQVLSTRGMSPEQAADKIRGRAGTRVKLTLRREGIAKPLHLTMLRGSSSPDTVRGYRLKKDDTWDYWLDRRNRIAYVRLTQFARRSHFDLCETVADLKRQGVKGLILDLRFNPGGLLSSAIQVSELFIKKDATIFSVRPRVGRGKTYSSTATDSPLNLPIVCLINGESASSSEIVSGCLQDHHRALIVGARSRGKGCVQTIMPFGQGELIFTTAMFVRPCGKKVERTPVPGYPDADWGVTPDRGYTLTLPARERERLREYLDSRSFLVRRDRPFRDPFAKFTDRQRDRALAYLRERTGTSSRSGAARGKPAGVIRTPAG